MICVGLSERGLKFFWGVTGGPGKILGGSGPPGTPLAPPPPLSLKEVPDSILENFLRL